VAGLAILMLWPGGGAATAQPAAGGLPSDVQNLIRRQFGTPDTDPRYLDASVDLNGDGKPELIIHVVGGTACASGGCPTLVFTPAGSGYRLVTTISVTQAPIHVSSVRTLGWRNLIVHVSGGAAQPGDFELAFDGKSYPRNPTVAGPRVKKVSAVNGDVLIKDYTFDQTKQLPKTAAAASAATTAPSFDCTKATAPVEKLICGDKELAARDRTLTDAYAKAMAEWPDSEKTKQRAAQRTWTASRNACDQDAKAKACVEESYRRRLIEVQIKGGQLMVPTAVGYVCQGHEREPFHGGVLQPDRSEKRCSHPWRQAGDRVCRAGRQRRALHEYRFRVLGAPGRSDSQMVGCDPHVQTKMSPAARTT
jgi:uncharacterized protein YecT (DUF1311 family)